MFTPDGLGRAHPSSPRPATGSDLEANNFVTATYAPLDRLSMFKTDEDAKFSAVEWRAPVDETLFNCGRKELTYPLDASSPQQTATMKYELNIAPMVTKYNVTIDEKLLGVTASLEQPYEGNN